MRALRYLHQLLHLVHLVLRWFRLDTPAGRFDLLATGFWIGLLLDYPKPGHGHALIYLLAYLYCSRRANGPPPSPTSANEEKRS
jgi:hypothetical protein